MNTLTNALTEKGNLKTEVSKAIKAQAIEAIAALGFEVKENGRLAKVVADANGHIVTINMDLAVGLDTDFAKKVKAPKAKAEAEPVDIPDLFN